jgi:hypothetical protein
MISDELRMYLQERRRMLLSEVASIERLMGIERGRDAGRVRHDTQGNVDAICAQDRTPRAEGIRRG